MEGTGGDSKRTRGKKSKEEENNEEEETEEERNPRSRGAVKRERRTVKLHLVAPSPVI